MSRIHILTRTCQSGLLVLSLSLFVPSLAQSFHARWDGALAQACCEARVRAISRHGERSARPVAAPTSTAWQVPLHVGAQSWTPHTRQTVHEIRQGEQVVGLLLSAEYH